MIWIAVIIEAPLIALCIYQIRELTKRIRLIMVLHERTVRISEELSRQINDIAENMTKTADLAKLAEMRTQNNEHRLHECYKAINQLKGWPNNEIE